MSEFGQCDLFTGVVAPLRKPSKFAERANEDGQLDSLFPEGDGVWDAKLREGLETRLLNGVLIADLKTCLQAYVADRHNDEKAYWRRLTTNHEKLKLTDMTYAEGLFSDLLWISEKGPVLSTCLTMEGVAMESFVDNILCGFAKEWNYFVSMQDGALFAESSNAEH